MNRKIFWLEGVHFVPATLAVLVFLALAVPLKSQTSPPAAAVVVQTNEFFDPVDLTRFQNLKVRVGNYFSDEPAHVTISLFHAETGARMQVLFDGVIQPGQGVGREIRGIDLIPVGGHTTIPVFLRYLSKTKTTEAALNIRKLDEPVPGSLQVVDPHTNVTMFALSPRRHDFSVTPCPAGLCP